MKTFIDELIDKYNLNYKEVRDTIEVLCSKGIANGAFQNYVTLQAVLEWLEYLERMVKSI